MDKSKEAFEKLQEENKYKSDRIRDAQNELIRLGRELSALKARIAELKEAVIASESAFLTQVGCDYNDVIHAAYMMCKEAIKKEVTK